MNCTTPPLPVPGEQPESVQPVHFLETIHRFEADLRINIVSTEIEIILALFDRSPLAVSDLQGHCTASASKFFSVLRDLQQRNIVSRTVDPADRRRRLYELPVEVRAYIFDTFDKCIEVVRGADLTDEARLLVIFEEAREAVGNHYGIPFTSFRYNILSSLFRLGHWHPGDGHKLADTSQVSFYAALDHLKSIGAIECVEDPRDRRKKRCQLTADTRDTFVKTVSTMFAQMVELAETRAFVVAPLVFLLA